LEAGLLERLLREVVGGHGTEADRSHAHCAHIATLLADHPVASPIVSRPRTIIDDVLSEYRPCDEGEAADVARIRQLAQTDDPWRAMPLHVTASAVIVHPPTRRALLRWHQRQQAWLQVGGHGEPGESDPVEVALREGAEETGLADLIPWPDARLVHAVIVPVPAKDDDPAHEHADLRFLLSTSEPERARPERPVAQLRWLSLADAQAATSEANLRETLRRVEHLVIAESEPLP
jgi:8-oxo-dGTP pyrophosphatase MutT (NUDIX family)